MQKTSLILLAVFSLMIGACAKNNKGNVVARNKGVPKTPWTKNPPSVPTVPKPTSPNNPTPVDPAVVRTVVPEFEFANAFSDEMYTGKNYYEPDNCVQWVKMTKGAQVIGNYLEISATTCPAVGVVSDDQVLVRLKIDSNPSALEQFPIIYEQSASPEIGMIRKYEINGKPSYQLEGLCDVDPIGWERDWSTYCTIKLDGSSWANPPFEMQYLD